MIYTSYYDNIKNLPKNIIPISIAGKAPSDYIGLEYKKLAPKLKFWKEWEKNKNNYFYAENFKTEVLDKLSIEEVIEDLKNLKSTFDSSFEICLICYEKPEEFCHRHLVSNWFKTNGYECMEFGEKEILDVGYFGFQEDEEDRIYTNNYKTFFDKEGKILEREDLERWALCLNSPWSQEFETFEIRCNCKDSYTQMKDCNPTFVCEKIVIGYEAITGTLLTYGFTEEEALQNCLKIFKKLQKEYNPKNESF